MTASHDPDSILAAWLDEGPTALPDATRRAIVGAIPTTPQARRGRIAPWRLLDMNGLGRLAGAAIVAALAIGGLLYVTGPRVGFGTPSPSPQPEPTSPAPTSATALFVSPQFGYSIEHPAAWRPVAATSDWPEGGAWDPYQDYVDVFRPSGSPLGAVVFIAARAVPDGTSNLAWMTQWAEDREAGLGACSAPAGTWTDAFVGGVPARRSEAPCGADETGMKALLEYAWVVDGVGYVISGTPAVVESMVPTFKAP